MSECDVCIGGGFSFEFTDEYHLEIVTCSNDLECEECGRPIPAGTEYERLLAEDENGEHHDLSTCLDCANIANALSCEGRCHSRLWEQLEDEEGFENFNEGCLAEVETASAKAYLVERWRKWKGLA